MIDDALWKSTAAALPAYCERQRWYADKARPIRSIELIDAATVVQGNEQIIFALIQIDYTEGSGRRYFVPVAVRSAPAPERFTIAVHEQGGSRLWIQDAPSDRRFRDFLVEAGHGSTLAGMHGIFDFETWRVDGAPFELDPATQSSAVGLEQSNSSIAYGTQAMLKLYRRLEAGQNIEVDMNRYLASEAHLDAVPKLIGCITYREQSGEIPLALVQQHVGPHRDCWSALTDSLSSGNGDPLDLAKRLGAVTGEMHVALSAAPPSSPLAPEPITAEDISDWQRSFLQAADETDRLIRERLPILPPRSERAARDHLAQPRQWESRSQGFASLTGLYKTRVHGDYHLGQVLLTSDGRLLIVDFEGEPQRSAEERAAKYSPLRDVAGMLRSFAYARGFAEATPDGHVAVSQRASLDRWLRDARAGFLESYRRTIATANLPIAPDDDETFDSALSALENEKALYEVRYELNSRPDWAWLPLERLD